MKEPASLMVLAGLLAGCAAPPPSAESAPVAATGAQPSTDVPAADPDKVICKRVNQTGSRLGGERICKSRAAWDEIARNARDGLDDTSRRSAQSTLPDGA